jgi:glycosyltransferase involved in cell wall biosynthesis
MIAPTPFFADRGCHVRIYEEARALQKLGCKITICTYHNGRDIPGIDTRRIVNIPWYKKLEAGPSFHMVYLDTLLLFKSLITALKLKPDIIHGHLHEGAFIGFFIARILRKPLIFDCQGSLTGEMEDHNFLRGNRPFYACMRFIEKRIDNSANGIITSSTAVAKDLNEKFSVSLDRIYPTLDGVDTDEFRPFTDLDDLRVKLSLPPDKKIVVYLGLLNEYQGVDYLIKAIPLVLKQNQKIHFLIMGYPNVEKYEKMAEGLGVAENIIFTGRVDYKEAPRYLSLGDIAVAPKTSMTEANGKIYNYMACGLPTVVFDTLPSREILGDLGVYALKEDSDSLAKRITDLLADEGMRTKLSKEVRDKAVKDYSWLEIGGVIVNVYRRLAA